MELAGRHVVVTGGAGGIGRALARRVSAEGVRGLVVADREHETAHAVAEEVGGLAVEFDAGLESSVSALISQASDAYGPVGKLANPKLADRFDQTIAAFMDLAEAAKHYPCAKTAWVEFLGERPDSPVDRVDTPA